MGRSFGFLAAMIVVGVGLFLYSTQARNITREDGRPAAVADVTGVRMDLLALANAERIYYATNSRYASLEELRDQGDITRISRPNFTYFAETTDYGFNIIATYSGEDPEAPRRIAVDQTLTIRTE
jgi:hypothetical protein